MVAVAYPPLYCPTWTYFDICAGLRSGTVYLYGVLGYNTQKDECKKINLEAISDEELSSVVRHLDRLITGITCRYMKLMQSLSSDDDLVDGYAESIEPYQDLRTFFKEEIDRRDEENDHIRQQNMTLEERKQEFDQVVPLLTYEDLETIIHCSPVTIAEIGNRFAGYNTAIPGRRKEADQDDLEYRFAEWKLERVQKEHRRRATKKQRKRRSA